MIYRAAMLGAAGGAFSPDDIAGLQLWLDASDLSTITESSGAVSQWDDKSGNGNHVTQGTAANQPTTGTRTLNGLNVLDFDGSDDSMKPTLFNLSQPNTVLCVVEPDAVSGSFQYIVDERNANDNRHIVGFTNTGGFRIFAGTAIDGGTASTQPYVLTATFDGASSSLHANGASTLSGNAGANSWDVGTVGNARGVGGNPFDGKIAELIVYNAALSSANREALEQYLAAKWGITLS